MPNSRHPDQTSSRIHCSSDDLKRFARGFHSLAERFKEVAQSKDRPEDLRWTLSQDLGVQAGRLLCESFDAGAFPNYPKGCAKPNWDFRGDDTSTRIRLLLADLAQSNERLSFALLSAHSPNSLRMDEHQKATKPDWLKVETATNEDLAQSIKRALAEAEMYEVQDEQDDIDTIYLLAWLAAVRWDIVEANPQIFSSSVRHQFHPWVDSLSPTPPVGPGRRRTPLPDSETTDADKVFVLRKQAQVQVEACRVFLDLLVEAFDAVNAAARVVEAGDGSEVQEDLRPDDAELGKAAIGVTQVVEQTSVQNIELNINFPFPSDAAGTAESKTATTDPPPEAAEPAEGPQDPTAEGGPTQETGTGRGADASRRDVDHRKAWEPPEGYVRVSTIQGDEEYQKDGKNPPRTTIQQWETRDRPDIVQDPATTENCYPKGWVSECMKKWSPRKQRKTSTKS